MGKVVHFEIHADDPARAVKFYEDAFGWKIQKWEGPFEYYMLITGDESEPGINGGIMKRMGPPPVQGQAVNSYVCTINVESLDNSIKKLELLGSKTVVPKMAVHGVGWLCYCLDSELNIFGIMQSDPDAK
ncbi:MAG: VOC family protein [Ignavibacteria bacterium]